MLASDRVGPATPGHGPNPWSAEEANARLPELKEVLPNLRAWVVRLRKVHAERRRLSEFWGKEFEAPDHPDRPLRLRLTEEEQELTQLLEEALERLDQDGIEVKDLDTGLVDFRSVRDGQPIYLCWQRGEASVSFYHTLEGGYRSRQPLDVPPEPSEAPELPGSER
jgi:hypothetical protein